MNSRDAQLLQLRPEILSARVDDTMSADEQFQNGTLRPVVKLQNDLLVEAFRNYIKKHKNVFYTLNIDRRMEYMDLQQKTGL